MSILTAIKDFFTPFDLEGTRRAFDAHDLAREDWIRDYTDFQSRVESTLPSDDFRVKMDVIFHLTDEGWDDRRLPDDFRTERRELIARMHTIRQRGAELYRKIGA